MSTQGGDAGTADGEAKKVNRPSDSRLKQQKLKAWQPILTAGTVLPTFFVIGVIFIPIGAVLLIASNSVTEYVIDYTDCKSSMQNGNSCISEIDANPDKKCYCTVTFNITDTIDKSDGIYLYYGLSNFYQNHRRYVKSRDDKQLLGINVNDPASECAPYQKVNNNVSIAPCGAIANSMFNDVFLLKKLDDADNTFKAVNLNYSGIAWPSDRSQKFANPKDSSVFFLTEKPPRWSVPVYNLSSDPSENGFTNESFIVWMRVSALPTFRKLHSRVIANALPKGVYALQVEYNFAVHQFDGKKRFIISTTSWAGGKNPFLGVAYIVVGCLCILTGTIFFFIHLKFGKSLTEMANIHAR